ncbi:MAG TPA: hypothetical protein VI542_15610 [Candidatus Tectomicrobia bacterium]
MMAWPTDDDMLIRHYVRTCPIRTRSTQVVARSTLWRFQQFVRTSRPNEPLSQATLTAWLHHNHHAGIASQCDRSGPAC